MQQRTMGWVTVFLLFLVYMINYLDRVALSIAAPLIERDLNMNAAQMGLVFSSFFFGYAIFNFIGGLATDRIGPKWIFVLAVTFWSAFCGMTALAGSFAVLLVLRVLFGMAEGPLCAGANKMVNNWIPRRQSATAMGLLSAGSPLGGALAGPIVGFLALSVGWRLAFVAICAIGLVWAAVWYFTVSDRPRGNRHVDPASIAPVDDPHTLAAASPCASPNARIIDYLKQPTVLATGVAFFGYNYILFFFLSWFPSYLVQAHHLNIKEMSLATVVPWLVGAVGLAMGGAISDGIYRLTGRLLLSRKLVLVTCLLGAAACVAAAGSVQNIGGAIALMSVALFFLYVTGALYWAIVQDVVHPERVGSVSGCIHFMGSVSGVVGPAVTGFIVQQSGTFAPAFLLAGAVAMVGAVLTAVFVRAPAARHALAAQRAAG